MTEIVDKKAGPGRKQCKKCGVIVGVRTGTCVCGEIFQKPQAAIPASEEKMEIKELPKKVPNFNDPEEIVESRKVSYTKSGRKRTTWTPSGDCPVKPRGYTKENFQFTDEIIAEWAKETYDSGDYLSEAVVYFARYFWDINSPEFDRVESIIRKTLPTCQISEKE